MTTAYFILAGDLVLQLIAACLALRLIRITGKIMPWTLLVLVLVFMALHRGFTFYRAVFTGVAALPTHDIICMTTSALMVAGVAFIGPLFRRIKTNEELLRQNEEKYRTIVETAYEGVIVVDSQELITYTNPRLSEIFGFSASEFLGQDPLHFLEDNDRVVVLNARESSRHGNKQSLELRIPRKDGVCVWASVSTSPIFGPGGQYLGGLGMVNDITERKRVEDLANIRAGQQAAVANLGLHALGGADLTALFNSAVELVSQNLQVEFCKVLELLPQGDGLLLRAGIGWRPGLVGAAVVEAGLDSQAGYTLATAKPVILTDLSAETRFSGPPLLREHGVVSGLSVVIAGENGPFGVLGAHTGQKRSFNQEDINFLQGVANVLAGAMALRRSEQALRQSEQKLRFLTSQLLSSQEKERGRLSLKLHEELGQTLQVLKMQTTTIKKGLQEHQSGLSQECETLAQQLVEIIDRLRGLSWELSPHSIEDLGLESALRHLIDDFHQHYQIRSFRADLDEIDDLYSVLEKITIFRILQGALSNIGQHAEATKVTLDIKRKPDEVSFVIVDNGKGFEAEEVLSQPGGARGFGLHAMEERVKMLGGVLLIHSGPGLGTELSFTLPIPLPSSGQN